MKSKFALSLALLSSINANAIELKEGLNLVFKENPTLQNEMKNLQIRSENIKQARSNFMPDITASYSWDDRHFNYKNSPSTDDSPSTGKISLSQDLFKGGENLAGYKEANLNYQAALSTFNQAQQTTFTNAADVYLSVLTAIEVLELNKRQVATSTEEMKRLKQRFDLGDITLPQLKEFEARRSGYIADKEEAYGDLLSAKANFLAIFDRNADDLNWPSLNAKLPSSLNETINKAKTDNPDVIKNKLNLEAANENTKKSRAKFMPSVSASASWANNSDYGGVDSDVTTFGFSASIPLFKGGENISNYNESKLKQKQSEDTLNQTLRNTKAAADTAFNSVLVQVEKVKALKVRLDSFAITTDAIEKQEAAGEASIIDVLDARDDEFSAQVDLKIARKKLVLAKLKLLSVIGQFTHKNIENIFE